MLWAASHGPDGCSLNHCPAVLSCPKCEEGIGEFRVWAGGTHAWPLAVLGACVFLPMEQKQNYCAHFFCVIGQG